MTDTPKRGPGRPSMHDEAMRQINVMLPTSDLEWMERIAKETDRSRNQVVRLAISRLRKLVEAGKEAV